MQCMVCGKVLRGTTMEAMLAHRRESESCVPPLGTDKNAPHAVKQAEAALQEVIEEGNRLKVSGSFDEIQNHTRRRAEAEQALKRARNESKAEKRAIKDLAVASMSAANWTQAVLGGESERFSRGEDAVEQRLAQETVGLVSSADFRERREQLETEAAERKVREVEAAQKRKQEKKRKREQQQRRGLSFTEDEDAG